MLRVRSSVVSFSLNHHSAHAIIHYFSSFASSASGGSSGASPSLTRSFSSWPSWCTAVSLATPNASASQPLCPLTREHNVAAADKLALDVHLGDGRPVAAVSPFTPDPPVLLDALAQLGVLEAVEGDNLLARDALDLEDLAHGAGEAALRLFRRALHEHDERVLLDGLPGSVHPGSIHIVDEFPRLVREGSALRKRCGCARDLGAGKGVLASEREGVTPTRVRRPARANMVNGGKRTVKPGEREGVYGCC